MTQAGFKIEAIGMLLYGVERWKAQLARDLGISRQYLTELIDGRQKMTRRIRADLTALSGRRLICVQMADEMCKGIEDPKLTAINC